MKIDDFVELNMINYDEEDVSNLNEWAIWAYGRIEELEYRHKQIKREFERLSGHFDDFRTSGIEDE